MGKYADRGGSSPSTMQKISSVSRSLLLAMLSSGNEHEYRAVKGEAQTHCNVGAFC